MFINFPLKIFRQIIISTNNEKSFSSQERLLFVLTWNEDF